MEPNSGDWSWEYGERPFDPVAGGFDGKLEFIGLMPYRKSMEIKASPIGIGYECIDHRKAYNFSKTLPIMQNSGVKWARVQTGWSRTETEKGTYDFSWLDEIVDGLLKVGIQPWLSISYGNLLYMDAENPKTSLAYAPIPFGKRAVQGWRNYCETLVKHYQNRVTHWEVWNEPNVGFWGTPEDPRPASPDPAEYVELVKITSEIIRKHQPGAKIIGGAISGGGCCNRYIKGLAENGIAEHIDIFSYHPYGTIPELYIEDRLKYIKSLFANCGRNIEFWQGECGRPSQTQVRGRGYKLTTANQARYLTRRILTDLHIGFDMTSYFCTGDIGSAYKPGGIHGQGVIDTSGEEYFPKPAFFALQSMACLFDAETIPIISNIEVTPPDGWGGFLASSAELYPVTAGFRRGNTPIFAYYFPENIDIDYEIKRIFMSIWIEDGFDFSDPILIDPITRKVFKFKKAPVRNAKDMYDFHSLPMLDYPLFITSYNLLKSINGN